MPRQRHRLRDIEKEAQSAFYLVELTWDDGVKTSFVILSPTKEYAIQAVEVKALNMWDGFIAHVTASVIPIPSAPNLPEHVYTDHSGYQSPESEVARG